MKCMSRVMKSAAALTAGAAVLLTPMCSFASGCSYSHSVVDPFTDESIWATHRCEVYSDDVLLQSSLTDYCSVMENVYLKGVCSDRNYDYEYVGYMGFEEANSTDDWASCWFGSMSLECAKANFGICKNGTWDWAYGYYQNAD